MEQLNQEKINQMITFLAYMTHFLFLIGSFVSLFASAFLHVISDLSNIKESDKQMKNMHSKLCLKILLLQIFTILILYYTSNMLFSFLSILIFFYMVIACIIKMEKMKKNKSQTVNSNVNKINLKKINDLAKNIVILDPNDEYSKFAEPIKNFKK